MTLVIHPTSENILLAATRLKSGALIGLPTETVYGLAADAENENAVRRIYDVKGRPLNHPIIVHIGSISFLDKWAKDIPEYALTLAEKFWPGPMTLILKRSIFARNYITGGQDTIGIRIPDNLFALSILNKFHRIGGHGVAAPSANKFGALSPTDANSVLEELGDKLRLNSDLIIDGGPSNIGIESTIIDCTKNLPKILRYGPLTREQISFFLNVKLSNYASEYDIRHSGNFRSHYSPKAELIINGEVKSGDGFIGLRNVETPQGCIRLASPNNLVDYASSIYAALRHGDRLGLARIKVELPVGEGLATAIRDRMMKAAQR